MRAIILSILLLAGAASAEPTEVTFINADATRSTEMVRLCIDGGDCIERAVGCAPRATCTEVFELPVGELTLSMYARGEDAPLSVESNQETYAVVDESAKCLATEVCRADFDGDGNVSASDFGTFFRVYGTSQWDMNW